MKQAITHKVYRKLLVVVVFAMAAVSCGKLDNLDMDDFDLFGSDDDKAALQLRTYTEPGMSSAPLVEYILDNANPQSKDYENDIQKTCDYSKMPFRSVDLKTWDASPQIPATARVVCIYDTKKLSPASISKLMDFVSTGGTLFLPYAGEDKRAAFLMGFKPEAEFETDIKSKGFFFKVPMLPALKNQTYNEEGIHYGWAKENFGKNIRILATSINNPNFPLIVENKIGKGKVVLYNTTQAFTKIDRGLMFSGLLKGLEGIPYPIANTSTIFLDDFPSPLYNVKEEPVKKEMDLTITDFVKKVWWPDMEFLAKKYNISYSAMVCFDYKNKTQPPFLFDQWNENKFKGDGKVEPISEWLANDAKKKGHELSLHGYNHVEFLKGEWPNPEFIPTALKAVQKKWQVSNFGALPVTYVPPSNHIDKDGVNWLYKGMPSIKYMCSLYIGGIDDGGDREFDFEPYNKNFFDYPRISSGFYMDTQTTYAAESAYLFTGIWTHFVHPDDIYQIDRPGNISKGDDDLRNARNLGWRKTNGKDYGMFTEFDAMLKRMSVTYPQIRYVNAGEGGKIVNDWRASKFQHTAEDGKYTVSELNPEKSLSDKQYWFMYGSFENTPKLEAQLKNESALYSKTPYMDGYLFTIYTNKSTLTLRDLQYKSPAEKASDVKMSKKVKDDYKRYVASVRRFVNGGSAGSEDDPDAKLFRDMEALKKRMMADTKIDSVAWNKYARYMISEDRTEEVWKMLGEYCTKFPAKENIMYSQQLNKIIEYPNELTKEKWLSAQMLVTPNDKDLLNSYIADFYTPENQEKIRNALVNLLKVDTSFGTYLQYIQHLLVYDPPEALKELSNKKPTAEFKPVATDAAWLFANDNQFQKAYEWSQLSDEIDFPTKMNWLIEIKAMKQLETEYKKYIVKNPNDYASKALMASVYHDNDRFRDSWILANSLPDIPEKDDLRKMLNTDVLYVDEDLQQELIEDHADLFYPEVLEKLTKNYRKERGDFIAFNSETETNRTDPSAFKNVLSYNTYDKKGNLHSFAATYSTMYKVNIKVKDNDNVTHAIGGLQYQFNSPKDAEHFHYWYKGRAEYSDFHKFYGQIGGGANYVFDKNYNSLELRVFPTETGPSHSKMIYRTQLNFYQDYYFFKHINPSLSVEGNYYMDSRSNLLVRIGKSYEFSVTGKIAWDNGIEKKNKIIPFVEGSRTQASIGEFTIDPSLGYPYWMIDDRLYGGGGVGWKHGLESGNLQSKLEATWFFDDYTNSFQRYTGEIAWQIFDYTAITASFEVYAQDKFFSNTVRFGVKYNLKKRKKK